jgi:uncharacterized protein
MTETTARPFTAASYNQYLVEHKLAGSRCPACDATYLPPRAICPRCHGENLEWVEFSGKGKLAAFTSIGVGPSAMIAEGFGRNNPYVSGVVELDEGPKISARILGVDATRPATIHIGTPMTATYLERGEGDQKVALLAFTAE